LEDTK